MKLHWLAENMLVLLYIREVNKYLSNQHMPNISWWNSLAFSRNKYHFPYFIQQIWHQISADSWVKYALISFSHFRSTFFLSHSPSISNLGFLFNVPFHFPFLFQSISLSILFLVSMNFYFNFQLRIFCKLSCCYCWMMF
jgi:hypothetical protein